MNRGFSLVEMLSVVAIISIVALIGFYNLGQQKSNSNDDIATIEDVFWRARNWARNHNVCTQIAIKGQTMTISSFIETDCSVPFKGALTFVFAVTIPVSTTLGAFTPSSPFIFNQNGGTIYNQPGTFVVTNAKGASTTFTVYPVIGQVRVKQ